MRLHSLVLFFFVLGDDNLIDMHHDLLSIMYYSRYVLNDTNFLDRWLKDFNKNNVSGLIANLYFMSPEEMRHELGDKEINVVDMFKKSTAMFKELLPDTEVLFSIEGCDYISGPDELEELYNLGLRNILLVWNCPNKYGSGNRDNYGLTPLGKEFLIKAIDLGISIDMSHMNRNTFFDTINLIKEQKELGKEVKVIASHSNTKRYCSHIRGLEDDQIKALREVDGILGLVGFVPFIKDEDNEMDPKEVYLKHILHAIQLMDIDHIGVSTDDMVFSIELFGDNYGDMLFKHETVKRDLVDLLKTKFNDKDVNKILYENVNNKLLRRNYEKN